jgi:hypothetical protein
MQGRSDRAARYQATAREVRRLAEHAASPEVRADLFDLAERFERLAKYLTGEEEEPSLSRPLSLGLRTADRDGTPSGKTARYRRCAR